MRSTRWTTGAVLLLALGGGLAFAEEGARAAEADEPETLWDLLLEKYDADKDGIVAKSEYTRSEKAFTTLDRNEDAVLTKADFRGPPPRPAGPPPGAGPQGPGREGGPEGRPVRGEGPQGWSRPTPGGRGPGGPGHGPRMREGGGERCPSCGCECGGGNAPRHPPGRRDHRGPPPGGPRPEGPPPRPPPEAQPPEER